LMCKPFSARELIVVIDELLNESGNDGTVEGANAA